jgi:ComF family protein
MGVVDILFPRQCLGCGKKGQYFCLACLEKIKPKRPPICPQCAKQSILGTTHAGCLRPQSLDGLVSVFSYAGIIKEAVKKLKYSFVTDLAEELIILTIRIVRKYEGKFWPRFGPGWTLGPVPLHPRRQRWRGFNQAELLGKILAAKMNWKFYPDLLVRHKYTMPQAKISDRKKRQTNIQGVFKVKPKSEFKISGRQIIVFDDIWTTGSTIRECGQVLKQKKASHVWGMTVAR